jgi:hypothetical protein
MVIFELALVGSVTGIGIAVWGKHGTRPTLGKVLSGKDQQNASTNPTSLARRGRAAQRAFLAKQAARYNPRRGLLLVALEGMHKRHLDWFTPALLPFRKRSKI